MNYIVLSSISLALLLAVAALIKERRLRLALQNILKRLIHRWRSYADTQNRRRPDRHDIDSDS